MLLNKKGVSMLYVLMALVCVGAMGSLVLSMAKKEKADSSLRYSSELARYAATAGLVYGSSFFTDTTNEHADKIILPLLIDWYNGKKDKIWITGSDFSDNSFLDKDGMKFRVKIVNIDFSKLKSVSNGENSPEDSYFTVMLQSESIDKSGSRAKNVAFYKITGFEKPGDNPYPKSALYMGSGIDEINVVVNVKGQTFMKGSGDINQNGHVFDGEFRRRGKAGGTSNDKPLILKSADFNGAAYFGLMEVGGSAPVMFSGEQTKFKKGLGADSRLMFTNDIQITGGAFFNGDAFCSWNGINSDGKNYLKFYGVPEGVEDTQKFKRLRARENIGSNTFVYGGGATIGEYYTAEPSAEENKKLSKMYNTNDNPPTDTSRESVAMYLFDSLDILPNDPRSITIKMDEIKDYIKTLTQIGDKTKGVTGDDLNNLYDTISGKYTDINGKEWMVIKFQPDGNPFESGGNGFSKKMILIVDKKSANVGSYATQFYKSAATGNSLIIVDDNDSIKQLGNNETIRGLIVNQGSGVLSLQSSGKNMLIKGAVYSVGAGKVRLDGGQDNKITFEYDEAAMKELAALGIIDDGTSIAEGDPIRIPKYQGRSSLLSRSF